MDKYNLSGARVSVVLTAYNRRDNLQRQIDAVRSQTHEVLEILVWENGTNASSPLTASGVDLFGSSSANLGVWARFVFALNVRGNFTWVLDDDTIPGPGWLKIALDTFEKHPGVIGSRGLRFKTSESYLIYDEFGPNNPGDAIEEVDLLGHNWIFPTSWLSYFFAEFANRFENPLVGEDLHLSHAVHKHLGLRCYVPPHPHDNKTIWGEVEEFSLYSGRDPAGVSFNQESLRKFENAFRHYVNQGFVPINGETAQMGDKLLGKLVGRAPAVSSKLARSLGITKNSD